MSQRLLFGDLLCKIVIQADLRVRGKASKGARQKYIAFLAGHFAKALNPYPYPYLTLTS